MDVPGGASGIREPRGSKWSKRVRCLGVRGLVAWTKSSKLLAKGVPGGCFPESSRLGAGFGPGLGSRFDEVTPRQRGAPSPPPASVIGAT
jgi:hypothetical protein